MEEYPSMLLVGITPLCLTSFKVNIMTKQRASVKGEFSPISGNNTRRVYDVAGNFKGLIIKSTQGYMVQRVDGKHRLKKTLAEAFRSIARQN